MTPDPNSLRRSEACPACGTMMLWTQNAWEQGESRSAAYRCMNGHVLDPAMTHECPTCGVHDTCIVEVAGEGPSARVCNACGARFTLPERAS